MRYGYLLSFVLVGGLMRCCGCAPDAETDRAALQRADELLKREPAPSFEEFDRLITELRYRFADPAVDMRIDAMLARNPGYAPAHLARANSLFRHGKPEAAIIEGNLALQNAGRSASIAELRAIHLLLFRACELAGDRQAAREHHLWLDHSRNVD